MTPPAVKSRALEIRALYSIDAIYVADALAIGSSRPRVRWSAKGIVGHDRRLSQFQDFEHLETPPAPEVPRG